MKRKQNKNKVLLTLLGTASLAMCTTSFCAQALQNQSVSLNTISVSKETRSIYEYQEGELVPRPNNTYTADSKSPSIKVPQLTIEKIQKIISDNDVLGSVLTDIESTYGYRAILGDVTAFGYTHDQALNGQCVINISI